MNTSSTNPAYSSWTSSKNFVTQSSSVKAEMEKIQSQLNENQSSENYDSSMQNRDSSSIANDILDSNSGQESDIVAPSSPKSGGTAITVVIRVRPPNNTEKNGPPGQLIRVVDEKCLVFDPPGERQQKQSFISSSRDRSKDISFGFDKIFDEDATQEDVFDMVKNTVFQEEGGLLDGYNCTVFAYGATGSGKTFSMAGTQENPGIMARSVEYIFQSIQNQTGRSAKICISYMEIYNEVIRDLLQPSDAKGKELKIVDDPQKGIIVTGLSHRYPTTTAEVLELIQIGNANRTQAPTEANANSSRSHAILQIIVENCDDVPGLTTVSKVGKLSLIDLAGSERATTNTGVRLRETAKINCSLLALGNCITALCNGSSHIPFRQSKLTRLLMDSLGGNCKTIYLSCISPSYMTYEDTFNTLQYANKAKNIKINIKKNTVNVKAHVAEYQQMIEKLRDQVHTLQSRAVNLPLVTNYGRTCDQLLEIQKHKITSLLNKSFPKSDASIQEKYEAVRKIPAVEFQRKCAQRVAAYTQESLKTRPTDETQKKWLEREQQIRQLNLEIYGLRLTAELYQSQLDIQSQLIDEISKQRANPTIPKKVPKIEIPEQKLESDASHNNNIMLSENSGLLSSDVDSNVASIPSILDSVRLLTDDFVSDSLNESESYKPKQNRFGARPISARRRTDNSIGGMQNNADADNMSIYSSASMMSSDGSALKKKKSINIREQFQILKAQKEKLRQSVTSRGLI